MQTCAKQGQMPEGEEKITDCTKFHFCIKLLLVLFNNFFFLFHSTILEMGSEQYADSSSFETFFSAVGNFLVMFSASAAIGIAFALISALISFNEMVFL